MAVAVDERVFAEVKRHCGADLDGDELLRRVAESLRRAVPWDVYCGATVDPASNLITRGVGSDWGDDADAAQTFLDVVYFAEDRQRTLAMLRDGHTVTLLSEVAGGKLERSLRYRFLLQPRNLGHELSANFVDRQLWGGLDLIRDAGRPDFTSRETALVRRIAPHVGAGLKVAALRARAAETAPGDVPGVPGMISLDEAGRVVAYTAGAEHHLADLDDLPPGWHERRDLPMALTMVSGALDRALHPPTEHDGDRLPRLRIRGRSNRWYTLYGALSEPAQGRAGERVVIIAPSQPEEIAWLQVAAYALSPREEEVVRLVVAGLATKQIAARLFIAEHTVQRHLSNIFEKVGVRSRRALVKHLFVEQLLPSLPTGAP